MTELEIPGGQLRQIEAFQVASEKREMLQADAPRVSLIALRASLPGFSGRGCLRRRRAVGGIGVAGASRNSTSSISPVIIIRSACSCITEPVVFATPYPRRPRRARSSSEAKVIAPPETQLLEFSASAARPLPDPLPTSEK
ncbi:hypothetical protein P0D88_48840 [Paraburkholderia sp. RL18-103-BIB-C]|uniref:hypothetical protein n=1 Tax=unclassified Paraburkholderia TaxID=2615204 RepID=UPI0038B79D9E